jgi:hypothetical protein
MARYASNDRLNLKVGVSSHSENLTSLEVVGRIGVNTDAAMQDLHVEGNTYISGSIGIGTSTPGGEVAGSNNSIINVGIVTAREFYGLGAGITGISSAGSATSIFGGDQGQLLYQHASGITSFLDNGGVGQGLFSRGPNQPPQWLAAAPVGAVQGITIFNQGAVVGTSGSVTQIDVRGTLVATATTGAGGIATITQAVVNEVGIATNVIGGIASVTKLDVNQPTGVSTIGNVEIDSLGVGLGATIGSGTNAGVVTYYGSGIQLSGIVTSIVAGANISVSGSTGQVTVTGLANTANIIADTIVSTSSSVSGISTLGTIYAGFTSTTSLNVTGVGTINQARTTNLDVSGVGTITTLHAGITSSASLNVSGIGTIADVKATGLTVSGVSTVGVITGTNGKAESIGVVTAYITDIVGSSATFTGNVTIGGTLIYEDVENIDSLGFVTARTGIHVGYDYAGGTGIGITLLPDGNGSFAGIITAPTVHVTDRLGIGTIDPKNAVQVGSANSSFTVVSTASSIQVGIGTTAPNYTLEVKGDTNIEGKLMVNENSIPSLGIVIALGGL